MLAALLPLALATAHATTGPFAVGYGDVAFDDKNHGQGTVYGRVYYPALTEGEGADADQDSGPYPLIAQLHGWLGSAWMYDEFCLEVASWGFVVAATDTETGMNLDMTEFAWDTRALIDHVEQESSRDRTPLSGLVDGGDLSAMGHSMGGATLGLLIELEPRVRNVVALMPYTGETSYYDNVASFTGNALYVTGDEDETATPDMVEDWFAHLQSARRGLFVALDGAGHQAVTDFQWGQESLDDQTQLEAVQHLATHFLRAEVLGDESRYQALIGPGLDHLNHTVLSNSRVPAVWAALDDGGRVSLGVAGAADATVDVHLGGQPGLEDSDGPVLDDAPLEGGVLQTTLDVPAQLIDGLYLQGNTHIDDVQEPTRVVELIAGEPAIAADEAGSDRDGIGSCSTVPRSGTIWLTFVGLMLGWRRSNSGSGSPPPRGTLDP